MQIIRDRNYLANLDIILDYIARDSLNKAIKFLNELDLAIQQIPNFPYKFRKSFYHNGENVRDFIFKGYTIPYLVDINKHKIIILDIFKWLDKQ